MNNSLTLSIVLTLLINICTLAQPPAGYYDGTNGLTGESLKTKLHLTIRNHTVKTYSEVKEVLKDIDEDPLNSNNVILIYSRKSISKNDFASNNESDFWNREHTWPKSHGFPNEQDTAYTDVHHLRPCDASINSSRSNKDFNNVDHTVANEEGEAPNTYTTNDFWEPTDEIKGDLARTMLYMATRYNSSTLDLELVNRNSYSGSPELGVLYTLLQWHENDPVSQEEIDRNNGVFGYQGNRNPFIDEPTWVASIWGNSTEPLLIVNQDAFNEDFGTIEAGNSLTQQYIVNGYNLTNDIEISVNTPFELSTDNTSWDQLITIPKGSSNPLESTVYLKFAPTAADGASYEANVLHSSVNTNDVAFTISGTEGTVPLLTIAEARTKVLGEVVNVTGVVIDKGNNSSNSRVIYDGTAGIVVRSFDAGNESANLNYGDSITVSGGLGSYNNLLQIVNSPIAITLIKEGAEVPEPMIVTLAEINESLESRLVTVNDVEFISSGTFAGGGSLGNFSITDGTVNFVLRIGSSSHPLVGITIPSSKLSITGIVGQYQSNYQLSPRDLIDLESGSEITGLTNPNSTILLFPNPVYNKLHIQGISKRIDQYNVSITSQEGKKVKIKYSDNSEYINVGNLAKGIYFMQLRNNSDRFVLRFVKD